MGQAHSVHAAIDAVLFDDCTRCSYISQNLEELDESNLKGLATLADAIYKGALARSQLTGNEHRAIENLRLMARIVFKSGITEEVAR